MYMTWLGIAKERVWKPKVNGGGWIVHGIPTLFTKRNTRKA